MAERTTTEALKDSFIADLMGQYLDLENIIKAIPADLKASLDALREVIATSPAQLDNTLLERLKLIDELHDQLKEVTELKGTEYLQKLDVKYKELVLQIESGLNKNIEKIIKDSMSQYKPSSNNINSTIIVGIFLAFFIGLMVGIFSYSIFNNYSSKNIENEYNKYIQINENSIDSMPKNCIDIYRKKFKENL